MQCSKLTFLFSSSLPSLDSKDSLKASIEGFSLPIRPNAITPKAISISSKDDIPVDKIMFLLVRAKSNKKGPLTNSPEGIFKVSNPSSSDKNFRLLLSNGVERN